MTYRWILPDGSMAEGLTEGLARAVEMNNLLFSAALSSVAVSGVEASRDLTLIDAVEGEEMLFEAFFWASCHRP